MIDAATRASALALYEAGDFEAAATAFVEALADAPTGRRNKRQGPPSKAFGSGVRLPLLTMQACGHVFNSAGCPTCPVCARRPAVMCATPEEWREIERRNTNVLAEKLLRSLARWARPNNTFADLLAARAGSDGA